MVQPYGLWKRGKIYYYRLTSGPWRSTGCTSKGKAIEFVLKRMEEVKKEAARAAREAKATGLRKYLEPYYCWDRCPHIARLRAEKKQISEQHARHQRSLIEKYILQDPIADLSVQELRRGDILDFRLRMLSDRSDRQANRIIGVLKTCLKEGIYREELQRDPTLGIGNIHHEAIERGIFTVEELQALFPKEGLGPWEDIQAYTCFLVAAAIGLRRGEVLALRWTDVDFDQAVLHVRQAWKDDVTLGLPKWGKVRDGVPLPTITANKLLELRGVSFHILPEALVFHNQDGSRKSARWWQDQFREAMKKAKIDAKARRLTAHSFRHSLNTILRDQGVPAEKIRAAMGWTNEKTQDSYTHFGSEHLRGQADIIDGIFH